MSEHSEQVDRSSGSAGEAAPPNPYAPVAEVAAEDVLANPGKIQIPEQPRLWQTSFMWVTICSLCAAPSFFFGFMITGGEILGMVAGIAIFSAIYVILDRLTHANPRRHEPLLRSTLRLTYGIRMVVSTVLPVGLYPDIICGSVTMAATHVIVGKGLKDDVEAPGFVFALVATLIQGVLMNLVLAVVACLIYFLRVGYRRVTSGAGNHQNNNHS